MCESSNLKIYSPENDVLEHNFNHALIFNQNIFWSNGIELCIDNYYIFLTIPKSFAVPKHHIFVWSIIL